MRTPIHTQDVNYLQREVLDHPSKVSLMVRDSVVSGVAGLTRPKKQLQYVLEVIAINPWQVMEQQVFYIKLRNICIK